jgi:hypothetical protein
MCIGMTNDARTAGRQVQGGTAHVCWGPHSNLTSVLITCFEVVHGVCT